MDSIKQAVIVTGRNQSDVIHDQHHDKNKNFSALLLNFPDMFFCFSTLGPKFPLLLCFCPSFSPSTPPHDQILSVGNTVGSCLSPKCLIPTVLDTAVSFNTDFQTKGKMSSYACSIPLYTKNRTQNLAHS